MRKIKEKRMTRRPGEVRYVLLGGLLWLYAMFFKKHKLVSKPPKGLKPPFIIVGNHSSFYDFVYAVRAFYPERISFVVARKYFYYSGLSWVMKVARAIPKSLYQSDTSTIIAMFSILKQGGIVGIYPEGQISINGITIENGETIAKFVKKAGVPVVRILTAGAYFCNPPWAKTARKGRIESRIDLVLTKEQVRELSADMIMEKIQQGIFIDSFEWQESVGYTYRGKDLALGLEDMLYICPHCKNEFTIRTAGNTIRCKSCAAGALYGEDGHLHWTADSYFRHIGDWHLWQVEQETAHIDGDFCVTEPVQLAMLRLKGTGVEVVGGGVITVDRTAYVYSGTLRGQAVRLSFPTAGIRYLPIDTGRNFQIYKNDILYEFRPENPVWCMKIANICQALRALPEREAAVNIAFQKARV